MRRPALDGCPPHLTLLFPFAPARRRSTGGWSTTSASSSPGTSRSRSTFESRGAFPRVLHLAPEPAEPFLALVHAAAQRYPEFPPYGGEIPLASIVPHLTVAYGEPPLLGEAEAEARPRLPIPAFAHEVVLLEELEPDWALWQPRAALPLGSALG